jgi:hypothetical protein
LLVVDDWIGLGWEKHRRTTRTVLLISKGSVKNNLWIDSNVRGGKIRQCLASLRIGSFERRHFLRLTMNARVLLDSQRRVEREMEGLILFLTHWVEASRMLVVLSKPHEYWRLRHHKVTTLNSKRKCGLRALQVLLPSVNQQTLIRIRMPFDVQDGRCTVRCTS